MTRKPRKLDEHLVSGKLLCHAYGNMGEIATFAGFFAYFTTMNVYGFQNKTLFGLVSVPAYNNQNNANYNEGNPFIASMQFTQSNMYNAGYVYPCSNYNTVANFPDWLSLSNSKVDLRTAFLNCRSDGYFEPAVYFPSTCYGYPGQNSSISGFPICFTTEALYYAQSAYFATVVMVQWSNIFACKSRKVLYFLFRLLSSTQPSTALCSTESCARPVSSCSSYIVQESTKSSEDDLFLSSCCAQDCYSLFFCWFGRKQESS